jgi:hypothetical protein
MLLSLGLLFGSGLGVIYYVVQVNSFVRIGVLLVFGLGVTSI